VVVRRKDYFETAGLKIIYNLQMVALAENLETKFENPLRGRAQNHRYRLGAECCSKSNSQGILPQTTYAECNRLESCSKDPIGYTDGFGAYQNYFAPSATDPLGWCAAKKCKLRSGLDVYRGKDVFGKTMELPDENGKVKTYDKWGGYVRFEAVAEDNDPTCCCFELWAKGEHAYLITIAGQGRKRIIIKNVLPGSGKELLKDKFQQDSPRICFSGNNFDQEEIPGHKTAPNDPNWKLLLDAIKQAGVTIEFDYQLSFEAKILDQCNKDNLVSQFDYTWKMLGPIDNPRIETTLKEKEKVNAGVKGDYDIDKIY
jgi:hypothetical protein